MLEKIFNFLPLKWKKSARLVSKRWFRIINHKLNLNVILSDKTISSTRYFTKTHLSSLVVKKLTQDILINYGAAIPPMISKLILGDGIPYVHLVKILKYYGSYIINCLEISSLSLSLSLEEPKNIPKLLTSSKWKYLKILKLVAVRRRDYLSAKYTSEFVTHLSAVAQVLKYASIPSLVQLSLHLDHEHFFLGLDSPLHNAYFLPNFIRRHQIYNKLKRLEVKLRRSGDVFPIDFLNLKKPMIQFESLKLDLLDQSGDSILQLLDTQRSVKNLEFCSYSASIELSSQLISNNSESMESLCILGLMSERVFHLFPKECKNLKSLSVVYFDNTIYFQQFLNIIARSSMPQLLKFTIIDTGFSSENLERIMGFVPRRGTEEPKIGDVCTAEVLQSITTARPGLKKIIFTFRGDQKHVSSMKLAADSILEKVEAIKRITINVQEKPGFAKQVRKQIHLIPKLVMNREKSDQHEVSVEVELNSSQHHRF